MLVQCKQQERILWFPEPLVVNSNTYLIKMVYSFIKAFSTNEIQRNEAAKEDLKKSAYAFSPENNGFINLLFPLCLVLFMYFE